MNSFDHSLKYLVAQQPADFIAFGLGRGAVEILGRVAATLAARDREVDDAYLASIEEQVQVVHLEYHRRHQALDELAVDVAEAQVRLFRRERRSVLSHVWDLYGGRGGALLEDRVLLLGQHPAGVASQSVYRRVNLRALTSEQLLLGAPPALWPLVPLTSNGDNIGSVRAACEAIEARTGVSAVVRADHLAVLLFMGTAEGLALDVLRAYIPKEKMMDSPLYREIFEEGEAKGLREGKAEGKTEAKADMLVRILVRRFNHVDDLLNQRIRLEMRSDVLDAWLDEAVLAADDQALLRLIDHVKRTPLPAAL